MEEVRKLGKRGRTGEEIVMAKVKTIEQKVMKRKGKLAEQKERLEDDLTWEERRIQCRIGRELQRVRWQRIRGGR